MSLHEIGRLFNRRSPGNLEIQPGRRHFPLPAGHHLLASDGLQPEKGHKTRVAPR